MMSLPGKKIATVEIEATLGDTPDTEVSLATVVTGNLKSYIENKGLFYFIYSDRSKIMRKIILMIGLVIALFLSGCGYKEGVTTATQKSYLYFSW
ncbi:MAG: hypothetical protein Q9M40_05445 [Sulfurimonas sp.]|nr:hypothetical protein [Sulfurimonas sp.]